MSVDDVRALQTIVKVPQAPSGRTYLASLILPFAEFSFVLKVQCEEHGMTGLREAMLLHDHLGGGGTFADFAPDDPIHDLQFPDHPVSRARRVLDHLRQTTVVDPDVRARERFPLPLPDA